MHSPVSPRSLIAAVPAMVGDGAAQERELEELFRSRYEARHVALMDSGTSALVEAFRMLAAVGRERVACPAYICVDVGAAAKAAGTSLALYDTDPATLSPDINSVAAALKSGAQAVLVAHLYGFPVDMRTVRELCSSHGAVLLEDAAQSAGGGYAGRPLGSFGDISVLSFGRGKGVTGGAGGALLLRDTEVSLPPPSVHRQRGVRGIRPLLAAAAQWVLGRPSLYGIPLSIPALQLGEMIYHPAGEPRPLSRASAAILSGSLDLAAEEIAIRQAHALVLSDLVQSSSGVHNVSVVQSGSPGYLRFPVLRAGEHAAPEPSLGITGGYPRLLNMEPQLSGVVHTVAGVALTGAEELRKNLLTLPTHGLMLERDIRRLSEWIRRT